MVETILLNMRKHEHGRVDTDISYLVVLLYNWLSRYLIGLCIILFKLRKGISLEETS